MKTHRYFVYILTNPSRSVFYTGVTNSLRRRVGEHTAAAEARMTKTFCGRYNCKHLMYHEEFQWILDAISREKQIKKYSCEKKLALIRSINPGLNELDIP